MVDSKVSLTLKLTPHPVPRHSSMQMLVPEENRSQRSTGGAGGVSTKNGSPQGGLQVGRGEGFHVGLQGQIPWVKHIAEHIEGDPFDQACVLSRERHCLYAPWGGRLGFML